MTFSKAVRTKALVVTAELPLTARTGSDIRRDAEVLKPVVDAVQLSDSRYGEVQMTSLAASAIMLESGLDPVMHLCCRDRNQVGLRSDLLGAAALGITSLILSRGEKLASASQKKPGRSGVFEIGATQLIAMANHIGTDKHWVEPPGFFLGSFATVFDPAPDWSPARLSEKADLGLAFVQTQPCLNVELLKRYMVQLVATRMIHKLHVFVDVPLISSALQVRKIKANHPGAPLPPLLVQRVLEAADPVAEGISLCARVLRDVADIPGVAGVNVRYDRGPEDVLEALAAAQLQSPDSAV